MLYRFLFFTVFTGFVFTACGYNIEFSQEELEHALKGQVQSVFVDGNIKLILQYAEKPFVRLDSKHDLDDVTVDYDNHVVTIKDISNDSRYFIKLFGVTVLEWGNSPERQTSCRVTCGVKDLRLIKARGKAKIDAYQVLSADDATIQCKGASSININQGSIKNITMVLKGSSDVTCNVASELESVTMTAKGASNVQIQSPLVQDAHVNVKGSSVVQLPKLKDLSLRARGSSLVSHQGVTGEYVSVNMRGASSMIQQPKR